MKSTKACATFIDQTLEEARREQKVKTLFGRVRPIPDINSKNANQRGFAERTAVNTPLQGTAADLIKIAMIRIDAALRERGLKSRMTLQVHDELVFEVPEKEVEAMRTPGARANGKCPSADSPAVGRNRSRKKLAGPGVRNAGARVPLVADGMNHVGTVGACPEQSRKLVQVRLFSFSNTSNPAELRSAQDGPEPRPYMVLAAPARAGHSRLHSQRLS